MSEEEKEAKENLDKLLADWDNEDISEIDLFILKRLIEKQEKVIDEIVDKIYPYMFTNGEKVFITYQPKDNYYSLSKEEIIDIIEEILQDPFVYFSQDSSYESVQIRATAIQELLKKYKQQQKEIEELKEKDNYWKGNAIPKNTINYLYVSKDKIREKLKKRAEMIKELSDEDNEGYIDTMAIDRIEYETGILQELLEE